VTVRRLFVALVSVGLVAWPGTARAHTEVDFTLPTDGASVGEPVTEITVGFTEEVTLVGPGFEVLDPQGNVLTPFAVTDDDQVFRLQLDPPLGGGDVGVRYEVTSADGHVVSGSFAFTVSVPAPTTTTAPPTTARPTTDAATTTAVEVATTTTSDTDPTTQPTAETTTPIPTTVAVEDDDGSSSTWIFLAVAGVIGIGAAAFLVFRSKPST
jgi:methionine-rich copper-binding protein CopC